MMLLAFAFVLSLSGYTGYKYHEKGCSGLTCPKEPVVCSNVNGDGSVKKE